MFHFTRENSADIFSGLPATPPFLFFGGVAFELQKQWFQVCQGLSRIWLERIQAESAQWMHFVGDLASTTSGAGIAQAYKATGAYQEAVPGAGTETHVIYDPGPEAGFDFAFEPPVKH